MHTALLIDSSLVRNTNAIDCSDRPFVNAIGRPKDWPYCTPRTRCVVQAGWAALPTNVRSYRCFAIWSCDQALHVFLLNGSPTQLPRCEGVKKLSRDDPLKIAGSHRQRTQTAHVVLVNSKDFYLTWSPFFAKSNRCKTCQSVVCHSKPREKATSALLK